ncbi:bifunctional aldolase/short-chain dehydrogenase [Ectothiorhodospiraceae bacterium BW-2]|nr:bifunctional aldolase/short-chain dehydrogenase [Ectothiorhodospiraceae bacterium BW-2]
MQSLWNERDAAELAGDELALRVYSSRLLGQEPRLVLHGGGNTSVKLSEPDLFGEQRELLYVKGSGWDLATIEKGGFAPVELRYLQRLATLPSLSDPDMVNELVSHTVRASAPTPSVEAILHAILPWRYVDHTHADAIVTLTNSPEGEARIRQIYGTKVVVIPYVMPGFDLARLCAERYQAQASEETIGMVLMNHGLFSFGHTAKESYERMIGLVTLAEAYLQQQGAWQLASSSEGVVPTAALAQNQAQLRAEISAAAGRALLLVGYHDPHSAAFARHERVESIANRGPATPDHVIRTKRLPLIGRDLESYVGAYQAYFDRYEPEAQERKQRLDPAPRVVLDRELGLCTVGKSGREARIVADIYQQTIDIILRAEMLGGYQALPAGDIFKVEYWDLEQAKLRKGGAAPLFAGEVALVTGAASGIGRAVVKSLLQRGAAVVGVDIDPTIGELNGDNALGLCGDITDESALSDLIYQAVRRFGGLDMVVANAGLFSAGCRIESLSGEVWRRTMAVNLDANLTLLRLCYPFLKLALNGGRVVVIGSKNVPAPGPGAAAYSASKAALNQLMRVAALEWGGENIRLNTLHPNGVFDTALWSEAVLQARAEHYGLTVEQYKSNNLLKTEVTSRDVAELAAEMCGPLFAKTTAAQVPVDGGNERVV